MQDTPVSAGKKVELMATLEEAFEELEVRTAPASLAAGSLSIYASGASAARCTTGGF